MRVQCYRQRHDLIQDDMLLVIKPVGYKSFVKTSRSTLMCNPSVIVTHIRCHTAVGIKFVTNIYHLHASGYYTYHQFNIHKFYFLPTQCIYVFCVDLRTNSDYFPIQH